MGLYLIIVGVQGAGKGTQAAFVKEKYTILHVSTGDLFRAMKTRQDDFAKRILEIMNSGQLVSDEITNEVVEERLGKNDASNGVILDGYPRSIPQAEWLDDYLEKKGEKVAAVLLLNLDPYTAFKRAFGRVKSETTDKFYNIYTNNDEIEFQTQDHPDEEFPPRLIARHKETGEILTRRIDDEAVPTLKRIETYLDVMPPVIEYYRSKDLVIDIDADQSIHVVKQAITEAINGVKV